MIYDIYIYIYIYICINTQNIHIFIYLPKNAIAGPPHSWSRDSQSQETFLALAADKQTRNSDTKCLKHHPSRSPEGTGIEPQQDKMVSYIFQSTRNAIVRLLHPYPWSRDSQGQETYI